MSLLDLSLVTSLSVFNDNFALFSGWGRGVIAIVVVIQEETTVSVVETRMVIESSVNMIAVVDKITHLITIVRSMKNQNKLKLW